MRRLLYSTQMPFFPDRSGGAELSTVYLLKALQTFGWQVQVLCAVSPDNFPDFPMALKRMEKSGDPSIVIVDREADFPCFRVLVRPNADLEWNRRLEERLSEFKPHVVVGYPDPWCPLLAHASAMGYPCIHMAHNLASLNCKRPLPAYLHVIANSPFTAQHLAPLTSKAIDLVYEMVDPDQYRAGDHHGKFITFINPIPEKGLVVALKIARQMPEAPFLFVRGGWELSKSDSLGTAAENLDNVRIVPFQKDMRPIYAQTAILLAPSQFIETFGRVILEAHISGIPVVASSVGGIPHVVGEGGVCIQPKDDPAPYMDAIRRLRTDRAYYDRLSEAAYRNAMRAEFNPQSQVLKFIGVIKEYLSD